MPIDASVMASAFMLGLAGAGHCLGMCGGVAAALNLGNARSLPVTFAYHGGRILSYATLGAAVGFLAGAIDILSWTIALRYIAGLLLIAMGLSIAKWWQGIRHLERVGSIIWQPFQKLGARWLPIRHWRHSLALGLCWGLMPCGLIYSSIAWAATTQNAASSALLMALFGAGTLPAMLATSLGADKVQSLLRSTQWRSAIGILLILSGVWTLFVVYQHGEHMSPQGGEGGEGGHEHHHMH